MHFADCATGEFSCDLKRCLPISKRCDGTEDCEDRTDEQECRKPINNFRVICNETCALFVDCSEDQFLCDQTRCISNEKRCDRRPDCNDGRDEANCPGPGECIDEWGELDVLPHTAW